MKTRDKFNVTTTEEHLEIPSVFKDKAKRFFWQSINTQKEVNKRETFLWILILFSDVCVSQEDENERMRIF